MRHSIPQFIADQWLPSNWPPVVRRDLTGRTVVVVGSNTGIGLEATKHLASMQPARVIMACRNTEKASKAASEVLEQTGTQAEVWPLDLMSSASVITFAERFEKEGGRLDLLIANAGIATYEYQQSADGWESTIQVNHLSTALLSLLLLPVMVRTAKESVETPRLVIVSSDVHYWATIPSKVMAAPNALEKICDRAYCTSEVMRSQYFISKLLNVLFTRELANHLATQPVVVDAVNPGFCYSEILRNIDSIFLAIMEKLLARTAEEGGRQLVYAAIGGENDAVMRGAFVANGRVREVSDYVLSAEGEEAQKRIWGETLHALAQVSPKVLDIEKRYLRA